MAKIGTRKLKIEVDGTEYTADVSNARVTSAESDADFLPFANAAAGGARAYRLEGTAAQDAATASLWDKIWSSAGDTVPVTLMPYGNATPSESEPHFTMQAVISEPDGDFVGGASTTSTSGAHTVEVSWRLTGRFTLDSGA